MAIDFNAIIQRIDAAQAAANAANLQRYQALLTHLDALGQQVGEAGTFGQATSLLSQVGEAARTRITAAETQAKATTEQGLTSRGLGGTTIRQTAMRGVASDAERARQEAAEALTQQRVGLLTQRAGMEAQIGGMKAAAIEGRQDIGPNLAMFASLLQAAAAGEDASSVARRTATVIGPQAQAGRSVFGTPFKYGGSGGIDPFSPSSGGGGYGGGGLAAAATAPTQGAIPFTTGAARDVPSPGWGAVGQTPLADQEAMTTISPGVTREAGALPAEAEKTQWTGEELMAPGGAESLLESVGLPPAQDGEVITDYNEYVKRVGKSKAVSAMYFHNVWGGKWSPGGR